MCWRSRTKSSFSGQVCQQGGPVGVQVVEVSTCWLRLISPQRTTRTEAAGGRRVTNQIWRNLMLAWPWEPRDTIGRMVATDLRHQHKPSHIYGKRWEYLPTWRSTIRELRSAINGFWRQALTIAMAIFLRVVNLQQNWYWVSYAGSDFLFFAYPFLSINHFIGKMIYYHHYQKEWFVIYSLDDSI